MNYGNYIINTMVKPAVHIVKNIKELFILFPSIKNTISGVIYIINYSAILAGKLFFNRLLTDC